HHGHTDNPDLLLGHYILLSGVVTATRSQLKCDDYVSSNQLKRIEQNDYSIHKKIFQSNYNF
ncbi:hypothetical protein ACQUW1_06660, partial [Klebsiella pneumoniae]